MIEIFKKIVNTLLIRNTREWHEDFIVHLASVLKPNTYVELGLYRCELFNRIIPYAQNLIGVDLANEPGTHMKKTNKTAFYHMTTDEYFKIAKSEGLSIDLLFIDANHSKESVQKDFENYFELVSEQGIILLHDGYPKNKEYAQAGYCGDGYKAIEELTKRNKDYEMMTLPVHPGLTLCRKRNTHLSW